jgi:hypothetical protein
MHVHHGCASSAATSMRFVRGGMAYWLLGLSTAWPNWSHKVSPNGVAHWACGARPSAYFAPQSQRATPSGPP